MWLTRLIAGCMQSLSHFLYNRIILREQKELTKNNLRTSPNSPLKFYKTKKNNNIRKKNDTLLRNIIQQTTMR